MAKAVRHGHRVVLIVATDGAAGLTSADFSGHLMETRSGELAESARILGVDEVVALGYPDSGLLAEQPQGFARQPLGQVADQIVEVANRVEADLLIGYDSAGGYGHPDHVHVHQAVRLAWPRTQARLFEATLPREPIARAVHLAARLGLTPSDFDPAEFDHAWTPARAISHRVNVRGSLAAKQAAIQAHASQGQADNTIRTLGVLSKLPKPIFGALLGREYYVSIDSTSSGSTSNGTQLMR
jgi:LmbE family N-acetylglucosaminyl deacetylase